MFYPDYLSSILPERVYFFNILNTVDNEFLQEKIKEVSLSKEIKPDVEENETIEIRSDLLNEINNAVYFSCKSLQ